MRKFSNFCGIFATVFVTTTIVLLASCSQDDDNYDSDMYTMAEMGTRLGGGDPGGGGPIPPTPYNGNPVQAGTDTINVELDSKDTIEVYISWSRGYTGISSPVSSISIGVSFLPILWGDTINYSIISSTGEWVGYNNDMKIRLRCYKDSTTVVNGVKSTITMIKDYKFDHHANCVYDPTL